MDDPGCRVDRFKRHHDFVEVGGLKLGCGKEGKVVLVKSGSQTISTGVLNEIQMALQKDHLTVLVETAA